MAYEKEKIYFSSIDNLKDYTTSYKNVLLVGNYITKKICDFNCVSLPDKDDAKTIDVVKILWDIFSKYKIDRNSLVVSVGGGSASDVVGFAASAYMRGVSFASIPTTLLAMIDASVGGKRAINYRAKNDIGSFYPSQFILIDKNYLSTLSKIDIKCGYCEAIKMHMITGVDIESNIEGLIKNCIEEKQKIVCEDFYDNEGKRIILNYGHTLAHAIEQAFNYDIPHGMAVGAGMDFAAYISLDKNIVKYQHKLFKQFNILDDILFIKNKLTNEKINKIIDYFWLDKKVNNDKISYVVLKDIAKPIISLLSINDIKFALIKYVKN